MSQSTYLLEDSELREWAYNSESFVSTGQDFELTVACLGRADIILECASDNECPKQLFFLSCAYQIIGDAVSSSSVNPSEQEILNFVRRAEKTGNPHLLEFVWRARSVIENPSEFEYDEWCGGQLARKLFCD